jgi:hypothetical protein
MLRTHENNPRAKAVETNIEVYDDKNNLIRVVANARMDGFADEVELPDGAEVYNLEIVPVVIKGVETAWTEGEGETVFVWDCRNELGEPVKQGLYRLDIKQADSFGSSNLISRIINIKEKRVN